MSKGKKPRPIIATPFHGMLIEWSNLEPDFCQVQDPSQGFRWRVYGNPWVDNSMPGSIFFSAVTSVVTDRIRARGWRLSVTAEKAQCSATVHTPNGFTLAKYDLRLEHVVLEAYLAAMHGEVQT